MRPNRPDLATLSTSGPQPSPLLPRPARTTAGIGVRLVAAATLLFIATLAVAVGVGWHINERSRVHATPIETANEEGPANVPIDRPPSVGATTRAASVPMPEGGVPKSSGTPSFIITYWAQ